MGRIDAIVDQTGKMNQLDVNAQNIQNTIDELNRSQDLLDALNNTPKIINKGSISLAWNGSLPGPPAPTVNVGSSTQFTFLAYYTRSDQPSNLYSIPDYVVDGSGNIIYRLVAYTKGNNLVFELFVDQTNPPITFTFFYFIIEQPANITAT